MNISGMKLKPSGNNQLVMLISSSGITPPMFQDEMLMFRVSR